MLGAHVKVAKWGLETRIHASLNGRVDYPIVVPEGLTPLVLPPIKLNCEVPYHQEPC